MATDEARAGNQAAYNRNRVLVSQYCCARCWGPLVEKAHTSPDGLVSWEVECAAGCPRGFIRTHTRDVIRNNALMEVDAIAMNYPEFDDRPRLSQEEAAAMRDVLWGE